MKLLITLLLLLSSFSASAITTSLNFTVVSCEYELIYQPKQSRGMYQQQQKLQSFDRQTCEEAWDECEREAERRERKNPKYKNRLDCMQSKQEQRIDDGDSKYDQEEEDDSSPCPSFDSCGSNPMYNGGGMASFMRYRQCIRNIEACLDGRPRDPNTGRYIWDDEDKI